MLYRATSANGGAAVSCALTRPDLVAARLGVELIHGTPPLGSDRVAGPSLRGPNSQSAQPRTPDA